MSTGSINLDILLNEIREDALSGAESSVESLRKRYPELSAQHAQEIHRMISSSLLEREGHETDARLVVTAPPSFGMKARPTKVAVQEMLEGARESILITGYSLSDYFSDMTKLIIDKSQKGVLVKFFVNDIEKQPQFDELLQFKGRFLHIYNFKSEEDQMAALHAKVISVDHRESLITSANLSYHGQEGNIELGTQIISEQIAKQIDDLFTRLLFEKVFTEVS